MPGRLLLGKHRGQSSNLILAGQPVLGGRRSRDEIAISAPEEGVSHTTMKGFTRRGESYDHERDLASDGEKGPRVV